MLAFTPEACQSFQEISFSVWLIGEAQWAHLVVLALDVAYGQHPPRR